MPKGISLNNVTLQRSQTRKSKPPVRLGKSRSLVSNHANVSLDTTPNKKTRKASVISRRVEQRRELNLNKIDKETNSKTLLERKMDNQTQKGSKSNQKLLEGVINFFSGKKEFRSLSNFWERDVIVDGSIYESGEHCFHGEKYTRLGEICEDKEREKQLLEYGQTFMKPSPYKTGAMAKKMGGKTGLLLTPEELKLWSSISVDVQTKICKYKFDAYEEVRQDLLKSDGKILVHPAMRCSEEKLESTCIWEGKGVVRDGKLVILGKNLLGNIWMSFR